MNKTIIKLLVGFIISIAVLISIGCPGVTLDTESDMRNKKIIAAIYENIENNPDLKRTVKNLKISIVDDKFIVSGSISDAQYMSQFIESFCLKKDPKLGCQCWCRGICVDCSEACSRELQILLKDFLVLKPDIREEIPQPDN